MSWYASLHLFVDEHCNSQFHGTCEHRKKQVARATSVAASGRFGTARWEIWSGELRDDWTQKLHPGKLTWNPKNWWFVDVSPFPFRGISRLEPLVFWFFRSQVVQDFFHQHYPITKVVGKMTFLVHW